MCTSGSRTITGIRIDIGRELAPKQFGLFCKSKGIIWEPSAEVLASIRISMS